MKFNVISIKIAELKFRTCYLNLIRGKLPEHLKEFNFFVKDGEDETKVAGGIAVPFLVGFIRIQYSMVDEELRKHHYGSKLMQMAEEMRESEAARR
ncbi:GNAT family N-acetyltransferase [Alkalihalobacillus pseudalcaliphilus]|uniref:GNAT family N-acetyltransferase n=1 Tax=Alkalihalobacillus pseudalcaliphilus TaxID=79884 RepID=UPI00064DBD3B|nr:GNAT family N-acetyltransferase [Alkalihalobacillus pseudalcaliphilus]KMK75615.1 hypothetical protein AB990_10025 [Alkalihalobacillus pseudalcaliphilus]